MSSNSGHAGRSIRVPDVPVGGDFKGLSPPPPGGIAPSMPPPQRSHSVDDHLHLDAQTVRQSGWLLKWPMHSWSWLGRVKRRFFVLRGGTLFYYYEHDGLRLNATPQGELSVQHDSEVLSLGPEKFTVQNADGTRLTLAADTRGDAEIWKETINDVIVLLRAERDLSYHNLSQSSFELQIGGLSNSERQEKGNVLAPRESLRFHFGDAEDDAAAAKALRQGASKTPGRRRRRLRPTTRRNGAAPVEAPDESDLSDASGPAHFGYSALPPYIVYILYLWIETIRDEAAFASFDDYDDDGEDGEVLPSGAPQPSAPTLASLTAHDAMSGDTDASKALAASTSFVDDAGEMKQSTGLSSGASGHVSSMSGGRTTSVSTSQDSESRRMMRRALSVPKVVYNFDLQSDPNRRLFNATEEGAKRRERELAEARKASSNSRESDPKAESKPLDALSTLLATQGAAKRWIGFRRGSSSSRSDAVPGERCKRVVRRWELLLARWVTILDARAGSLVLLRKHVTHYDKLVPGIVDEANLLRAAIRHKHLDCVQYLLDDRGVDIDVNNAYGNQPIHFSMLKNSDRDDHGAMLRYLIEKGADPTGTTLLGQTLLFNVARNNNCDAVELFEMLLRTKHTTKDGETRVLDLGQRDGYGATVLHHAVLFGNVELVKYLLSAAGYKIDALWTRANWINEIDTFSLYNMSTDEHITARNSWDARGLARFAQQLTPLGVAILHNQGTMARLLMSVDCGTGLLCRRRRMIFYDNNQDLRLLAMVWPSLIPDLLRMFSCESSDHGNLGYRATRYIIYPWFGHYKTPVYHTPLARMLDFRGADWNCLHRVKIIQIIIHLKWQLFGSRFYYSALARYVFLTTMYLLGFVIHTSIASGDLDTRENLPAFVLRWLAWAAALLLMVHEELRELLVSRWQYFHSAFNWLSLIGYTSVLLLTPLATLRGDSYGLDNEDRLLQGLRAIAGLTISLRVLEFLAIHKVTGRLVAMLERMLLDTLRWSGVFTLLLLSFSFSFFALLQGEPNFENLAATIFSVFRFSIGEAEPPFSDDDFRNATASIIFMFYTIIVHLLYLNVLIAMLSTSYEAVQEDTAADAAYSRASALVQWEATMSTKQRMAVYRRVCPPRGRRMHFTLPASSDAAGATDLFCEHDAATLFEPDTSFLALDASYYGGDMKRAIFRKMGALEERLDKVLRALEDEKKL